MSMVASVAILKAKSTTIFGRARCWGTVEFDVGHRVLGLLVSGITGGEKVSGTA
jgi:hypothetical protein